MVFFHVFQLFPQCACDLILLRTLNSTLGHVSGSSAAVSTCRLEVANIDIQKAIRIIDQGKNQPLKCELCDN